MTIARMCAFCSQHVVYTLVHTLERSNKYAIKP